MIVFVLFAAIVATEFVTAIQIGAALHKRHPAEFEHSRLHALNGYWIYVWLNRGRELGDLHLTKLLDRGRGIQVVALALAATYTAVTNLL